MSHGQQHHQQQHQHQQQPQSDYYFNFNDLDFGALPDMGGGGAPQQVQQPPGSGTVSAAELHNCTTLCLCWAAQQQWLTANTQQLPPGDGADGIDMSAAAAAAAFFGDQFLSGAGAGAFDTVPMSLDTDDAAAVVNDPSVFFSSFPAAPAPLIHPLAPLAPQDTDTVIRDSFPQDNPPPSTAAGPVPAPALASAPPPGASSSSGGGAAAAPSAASDFTKRRNWPAKVIEEMRDLLQILDGDGRIKYVSSSVTALAGYTQQELANQFLRDHIHPDDVGVFVADMNESIASGEALRIFYRFRKKNGEYVIFETTGHAHVAAPRFAPNPNNRSPFCQAVFMISRPYPTKNAGLLDTFLEHKVENDRLRRRIAELREEEETEEAEAQRQWRQRRGSRSELSRSEDGRTRASSMASGTVGGASFDGSMGPPASPAVSGALTRENLEGAVAGSRPDSLRDKMARYEGGAGSRAETIEMLTGRRYVDGDQTIGVGMVGAASGPGGNSGGGGGGRGNAMVITGDAGIAIPVGRDNRSGEKKKKQKLVEEYVCTDCGTLESPEWRKGPNGPKTLCNACGLRWAKKEKKRQMTGANIGTSTAGHTTRDQHMTGS